ncbi:MAG TPA: trypsin-like peptidase domain-containing protein [Gaiellaceae bacterium]|nr:trypsin-like peptidase domain-containing protein [Gaiellaceae bacterium]
MPRNRFFAAIVATAIVAAGVAAAVVGLTRGSSTHTVTVLEQGSSPVANTSSNQKSVSEIAQQATKSVVEVVATSSSFSQSPYPYGNSHASQSEGTGWVYDSDGHIVTNNHVIDGSSSVKVIFPDGSSYKATVTGTDPATDLAVLKVNAPSSKLTPLTIADSSKVEVGDGVVAIGDPFGLTGTVTTGIVSAVNREIQSPDGSPVEGAIQTDAAINHGNSGGPLFDLQGDVIGVTSQIESDSGGSDGVGFAIPSNTVKATAAQIISSGSVQHAFLGVAPQTVAGGVKLMSVESGSAAGKAGVKAGDVITAVNGKKVASASALRAVIEGYKPGDKVTLTITRNGSTKTIDVTLGTRPAN